MPAARFAIAAIVSAAIVSAAAVPTATAAEREQQHAGARCVAIADAAARLACYDQAFDRPPAEIVAPAAAGGTAAATSAAAASPAAPPVVETADATRGAEEFGLTETAKRKRDPEKARETMPESISASVASVVFRPSGEVVVALDNDQVWEQAEIVTTKARVKTGDAVTIRKSALGSYTLLTPSRMVIRVRRVR